MRFLTDSGDCDRARKPTIGGLIAVASKIGIFGQNNDFGAALGKNVIAEGSLSGAALCQSMPLRELLGAGVHVAFAQIPNGIRGLSHLT